MLDPTTRWPGGEKPDHAGLLTFAGLPYTEDAAELAGVDVADRSGRRWTSSSPTGRARASARARSGPRAARPGRQLETGVDAMAELRVVDFGDAPVIPADPVASHADDPAHGRRGGQRGRDPDRARGRPLDRRARRARMRATARPARPAALRHPHRHRPPRLRRRALARHADVPARRGRATSIPAATRRWVCAATGRAPRSSRGRSATASRRSRCTRCAVEGIAAALERALAVVGDGPARS